MTKKRRRPTGQTMGSIIVGFDQQIFRALPPAQELVAKAKPVRGLSGQDTGLEVVFPDDLDAEGGEQPTEPPSDNAEARDAGV